MPRKKKVEEVVEVPYFSEPEATIQRVTIVHGIQPLGLSLDVGREDLNENFRKIQEKINELINK